MFDSTLNDSRFLKSARHIGMALLAGVALAACGGGAETTSDTPVAAVSGNSSQYLLPNDHVTGAADAPVTLVEYASVSCGACANWHNTVYPEFKKKYVDTGKVRYVFREFVAGPPELADAGFMIALCAADDKYFQNIELQFKRQKQIFDLVGKNQAREAYIGLAKASGLNEDEFVACMGNQELRDEYRAKMQTGIDMGINTTPSFVINGEYIKKTPSGSGVFTMESLDEVLAPLLGEPVPTPTEESTE